MPPAQAKISSFLTNSTARRRPLGDSPSLFNTDSPQAAKRKRVFWPTKDPKQMVLDAGQKNLGAIRCEQCGMVYSVDDGADVREHDQFHHQKAAEKLFQVSRRQLDEFERANPSDVQVENFTRLSKRKVCYLTAKSKKTTLAKKIIEIVEDVINVEFGFSPDISIWGADNRCSVLAQLVEGDKNLTISSIIVREILEGGAQWNDTEEPFSEPETRLLGINRVWTHPNWRRRGLASALIAHDQRNRAKRCRMVAFSEPTDDGRRLAEKVNGSTRYLVYSIAK